MFLCPLVPFAHLVLLLVRVVNVPHNANNADDDQD